MTPVNKSYLSDLSLSVKKTLGASFLSSTPDPLALFRELRSKGINPINPIDTTETENPTPPLPDPEPVFDAEEERRLADFYVTRPRAERLAMHKRSLYIRTEKGWAWPSCDLTAYREACEAAGRARQTMTNPKGKIR